MPRQQVSCPSTKASSTHFLRQLKVVAANYTLMILPMHQVLAFGTRSRPSRGCRTVSILRRAGSVLLIKPRGKTKTIVVNVGSAMRALLNVLIFVISHAESFQTQLQVRQQTSQHFHGLVLALQYWFTLVIMDTLRPRNPHYVARQRSGSGRALPVIGY